MKTGALTTGALALGASAGTATAQDDGRGLLFGYEFHPETGFRVIGKLPASTTVTILRRRGGGTVPEIDTPSDYNGYVISYDVGSRRRGGLYTLLFTRRTLSRGTKYRLGGDGQMFSTGLNLVTARIRRD